MFSDENCASESVGTQKLPRFEPSEGSLAFSFEIGCVKMLLVLTIHQQPFLWKKQICFVSTWNQFENQSVHLLTAQNLVNSLY